MNNNIYEDISKRTQGDIYIGVVGPVRTGKSTFIRTLNRMNDLIEDVTIKGNISVDGEDIYTSDDVINLRTKVGMVFQKPNPFPMSIYDNVAYGPRTHGLRDKKQLDKIVEESLKGAAIWDEVKDRLKSSALGLSGGQQQRVAIARCLANDPQIIFADEPTGALDSETSREIMELLTRLNKQGKTIIMVTHDQDLTKYATKVIRLKDGVFTSEV